MIRNFGPCRNRESELYYVFGFMLYILTVRIPFPIYTPWRDSYVMLFEWFAVFVAFRRLTESVRIINDTKVGIVSVVIYQSPSSQH